MEKAFIFSLMSGYTAYNDAELSYFMQAGEAELTPYQGGNLILTDDKSPVEC